MRYFELIDAVGQDDVGWLCHGFLGSHGNVVAMSLALSVMPVMRGQTSGEQLMTNIHDKENT